jgi:ABC-type transport system substrate-binding protein
VAGGAALSLIGCGGDEGVEGDASGLLGRVQDTTRNAVPGGTWMDHLGTELTHMDMGVETVVTLRRQGGHVYQNLLKAGISATKRPGLEAVEGDAAESWEIAPDAMKITLKLRPNIKWDARPPTNGRPLTSDDVKASWDRYSTLSASAQDLANSRNKDAPVANLEIPDSRTVVFNLAFPYVSIVELLLSELYFYVLPRAEGFDFRTDMRGSGPFMLDSYTASQNIRFKKNPDYFEKPYPFFDAINRPLLTEYNSGLSQFVAKNIWSYAVKPEDIIATKRANSDMVMLASTEIAAGSHFVNFSKLPDSVFKDVRMRRAYSMLLERELLIETFFNVTPFRDAGLPVETYWNGHLAPGQPEWIDPKGTGLGEGAKYFRHDVAEARKLVKAAGFKPPVQSVYSYFNDNNPETVKENEVMAQMITESGVFRMELDGLSYNNTWRNARNSRGTGFIGVLHHQAAAVSAESIYTQKYTPTGRNAVGPDPIPGITDQVGKLRTEVDPLKHTAIIHDIEKKLALEWPDILRAGTTPGFALHWPWLKNYGVFKEGLGATAKSYVRYWYDAKLEKEITGKSQA